MFCVSDPVAVIFDLFDATKVSEPNTELWSTLANVIVITGNSGDCEWKVVDNNENPIPDSHFGGKGPIVFGVFRQRRLCCASKIANIISEVETDETSGETLNTVLQGTARVAWM